MIKMWLNLKMAASFQRIGRIIRIFMYHSDISHFQHKNGIIPFWHIQAYVGIRYFFPIVKHKNLKVLFKISIDRVEKATFGYILLYASIINVNIITSLP